MIKILAMLLLLAIPVSAAAENWYVIIYCDTIADIDTLTAAQKTELVTKYPPPAEVLASAAWQNATAAQKWTYWKANVMPPQLQNRIVRNGVLPILRDAADKLEIVQQYWKLAQEGTKYVFLVHLDVEAGQGAQIKNWLDRQTGLRYWYGRSMLIACRNLYQAGQDGDTIARAVAKRIIKYPVTVTVEGQQVTRFVPIIEAEAPPYSVTIQSSVLNQYRDEILPMKIFDGSK
jgi:hypothetical protein